MSDIYKLGQSQQKKIENIGEEIKIDLQLEENPYTDTGSVIGSIMDEDGSPIQGALVKILDSDHNPLYHTLTDEDGEYSIEDISPGSELHLHAIKKGYLLGDTVAFSISEGQTIVVDETLSLDPDVAKSTIAGHVLDNEDNPVENLVATLFKLVDGEEEIVLSTTTNKYGQYAFANIELGNYFVRLSGQGFETTTVEVIISEPGSITKVETIIQPSPEKSQGTINGVITDESGNPVVGAVVVLYEVTGEPGDETYTPIRYTRTISGGTYLFGNVSKGNYIVKANKEQIS